MSKEKETEYLRDKGKEWAINWLNAKGIPHETKEKLVFGTNAEGKKYGIWLSARHHVKKPDETVSINNLDYNQPNAFFSSEGINYFLIARGYKPKEDSEFSKDFSKYILVPNSLLIKYLVDRTPKKVNGKVTMDIGFTEKQIQRWTSEGVEYFPMFDKEFQNHDSTGTQSDPVWEGKFEGETLIEYRREQNEIRKQIFGDSSISECSICRKTYPIGLIWASHIKKRSICDDHEKGDISNICVPMCKMGCDDLFEKGFIVVKDGLIKINETKTFTPDLKDKVNPLLGTQCTVWGEKNKTYFEWHYDHHVKNENIL